MSNNNFTIRHGRSEDVSEILAIRRRTFQHFAPSTYSPEEVKNLLSDIKESELLVMIQNKSLFVAEKNSQVIGCGGWLDQSVRHMYVSPEITKQGLGSKLLDYLEQDYFDRTQNQTIKAGVILYARAFYEKNGYKFLRIETDWDGSKYCQMEKHTKQTQ